MMRFSANAESLDFRVHGRPVQAANVSVWRQMGSGPYRRLESFR